MYKLGIYFWIRVGVMAMSLTAVLLTIHHLNNPQSGGLLGVYRYFNGTKTGGESIRLCPTRASSVSVIGKAAVFQESLKWYRAGEGERTELDPIAVEKWFSEYCTIHAQPSTKPDGELQPVATVAYVSGLPSTLMQAADGTFLWQDKYFRSDELNQAFQALIQLPEARTPERK